jgi:transposase InsO family protein
MKSRLSASEFAPLVGLAEWTLYGWKKRFEAHGPAGLEDKALGAPRGSRLPEPTRRAILLLKESHPDWGQDRIQDVLVRSQGFAASPGAIGRVLEEEGYVVETARSSPREGEPKRFEAGRPNELWQTDLFTFVLRRENRRVHLVAFMDDHSRFVVGYGLHATASGLLVREALDAAIASFGAPLAVLTDNGPQYKSWNGVSEFTKHLERRGILHRVAAPRRPQTLGKQERFWKTLWEEMLEKAIFQGIEEARRRIGWFIDWYNFQRVHSALGHGVVPADRYFAAAREVQATLAARVARNAEDLARHGVPRKPFYLTGRVGDRPFSLHAEGEKVVLLNGEGRSEVDLSRPGRREEEVEAQPPAPLAPTARTGDAAEVLDPPREEGAPGTSPLDEALAPPSEAADERPRAREEGGAS